MTVTIRCILVSSVCALGLAACHAQTPDALGSLEYDRITLPAPAAERIVALPVREGQRVQAGSLLMRLDPARTQAQTAAIDAEAERQRNALSELRAGPRAEAIAQARAQLQAAQAQAAEAQSSYNRLAPLGRQKLVAAIDVDRARAAMQSAQANVRAAQQALQTLQNGTRPEQLAQGEAALTAAGAQADAQQTLLRKLTITAPRAGVIDSLPYKLGDQAPVGAPLAVLLVGEAPYARLYVPQALRARVKVGDAVDVRVDGNNTVYRGHVRMIRSEASYTPYFALTGKDAARLSYLAEVQLGAEASELPAGLPVRAEFAQTPMP